MVLNILNFRFLNTTQEDNFDLNKCNQITDLSILNLSVRRTSKLQTEQRTVTTVSRLNEIPDVYRTGRSPQNFISLICVIVAKDPFTLINTSRYTPYEVPTLVRKEFRTSVFLKQVEFSRF
jgi:hypothetical protein